nr:hypothetical protein [Candidatus Arsenophonus triatominarum]
MLKKKRDHTRSGSDGCLVFYLDNLKSIRSHGWVWVTTLRKTGLLTITNN